LEEKKGEGIGLSWLEKKETEGKHHDIAARSLRKKTKLA